MPDRLPDLWDLTRMQQAYEYAREWGGLVRVFLARPDSDEQDIYERAVSAAHFARVYLIASGQW